MKRVYITFANISDWDFARYWAAQNHHVVTSENFKAQQRIRKLPVMKIINDYRLDAHLDTESDWDRQVHVIVENVPDDVLMLLMLTIDPGDTLEAW